MDKYDYEDATDRLGKIGRWLLVGEPPKAPSHTWLYENLKYIEFALKQAQADLGKLDYKDRARVLDSSDGKLSTRKN